MLFQCTKYRDVRAKLLFANLRRSVHTNAFSKVCLFVVIDNASIDFGPHYCFDAFSTVHMKKFENDSVAL